MGSPAFQTARKAEYLVLELALPGRPKTNAGVLLFDPAARDLRIKLRHDWEAIAEEDDTEVLAHLEADLEQRARETGGEEFLRYLEDTLSNVLRISERRSITVGDLEKALDRLYRVHVQGEERGEVQVLPFQTHLPLYSLRAAATKFGEDMEVEPEGWVRAPENLRMTGDMFVAQVVGRSMEPLIPDGSLCIFRYGVVGSRQGKLLVIQQVGASQSGGEFTVKRYSSTKTATEESWRHERIHLEPLNPEFEPWDLEPPAFEDGQYRVCGEFIKVLAYEEQ